MSVYGYLNCHGCRQTLRLGKALHRDFRPFCFHIGGAATTRNRYIRTHFRSRPGV
jgi:hypothetical protein